MKKILSTLLAAAIMVPAMAIASPAKAPASVPVYHVKSYYIADDSFAKHGGDIKFANEDNYLGGTLSAENYKMVHESTRSYVASISNGEVTPGSVTYGTDIVLNKGSIVIDNSTLKMNDFTSGKYTLELPDFNKKTENISAKEIEGKVFPVKVDGGYELITISA